MVNVHVDLASGTNLYCANNGSGTVSAQSVIFGALSGSGNMNGGNTYTIGAKNTNTTYSGVIGSGSGKLIKNGAGIFTLAGANLYSGGTEINEGSLVLKSATAMGTGNVTVKNGAMLSLQTASCSAVNVGSKFTLEPTAILTLEVNPLAGQADLINLKNASLDGILNIIKIGNGNFEDGQKYQIFEATGLISGKFESILPAIPGDGLEWDTSELNESGIISIVKSSSVNNLSSSFIQVYPNPVNDVLNFAIDQGAELNSVIVKSISGQILAKYFLTENKLDFYNFIDGLYFVEFNTSKGRSIYKIVKSSSK